MSPHRVSPHGGVLVNLLSTEERVGELRELSRTLPGIGLTIRQLSDLELLMNGAYSPLSGFMNRSDYESVLDRMRLVDGTFWPMPVCLDVDEPTADTLSKSDFIALRDAEGFMLAVLRINDLWRVDHVREAEAVFGTADRRHSGVDHFFRDVKPIYIGGTIEGIQLPLHFAFRRLRHTPLEIRRLYQKLGWRRIVGFHTRNPLHRAQYEITLRAMARAKANLLLHPVVRRVRPGDIDTYTRVRCYLKLSRKYPPNMMLLSLLPFSMRMAGPRETLLHAIIRKNYGCSHFVVGVHHAGPGNGPDGEPFYEGNLSSQTALAHAAEIGIRILDFDRLVYVREEDAYVSESEIPDSGTTERMTDDEFHNRLRTGRKIPKWYSFSEVIEVLRRAYPPRYKQGFTIFCTGLSGAGKSTIARVLYARFQEMGGRPVTLLDGDIVRRNLSNELGFSKSHRDINVRRIGFVGGEITKNRGIAICAPIAPYAETRRHIREEIERYGGFIEVYVATPIEICEKRDRKGLYAKARAGLIKGFTGVDDPYEPPRAPEVMIDTSEMTPDEAVQEVLLYLERAGFIR